MKKHIVLSVNDNQDYLYFAPLVFWAWRKFGWDPILFYHRSQPTTDAEGNFNDRAYIEDLISRTGVQKPYFIDSIECYRSDTITQISRLYASEIPTMEGEELLMTGDIDMLPLSDYWKPGVDKITVYGHDLTGFGHYPICYISMKSHRWHSVMKLYDFDLNIKSINGNYNAAIKNDLDQLPQAKDPDFYKYWFSDQDLITRRLNEYGKDKITFVNRGQGTHGFARGRVDRGSGGWVLNQPELIDAHLEQQTHHSTTKVEKLNALLRHVWPSEDWTWWHQYTNEFRKLTGHTG
jgi:hypothetical protein